MILCNFYHESKFTSSVIVAENNIVCLPRGLSLTISSIWSLKFSSSILRKHTWTTHHLNTPKWKMTTEHMTLLVHQWRSNRASEQKNLSIPQPFCASIHHCLCLSVFLSVFLSVYLSVCVSICLWVCLLVVRSQSTFSLSFSYEVWQSNSPPVHKPTKQLVNQSSVTQSVCLSDRLTDSSLLCTCQLHPGQ